MIRSMTAFSRQQHQAPWGTLVWELRSVNHRYLETHIKLPDLLRDLETPVRNALRQRLSRGKVELNLRHTSTTHSNNQLTINTALVQQLADAAQQLTQQLTDTSPLAIADILNWPGVLETPSTQVDTIKTAALDSFHTALDDFIAAREHEGQELKQLIHSRLQQLQDQIELARPRTPHTIAHQRDKLLKRLQELPIEPHHERLEQEMVYWAQKLDVSEELDRLQTHHDETQRILQQGGTIGRRLDFLMQELNREANTFASKSLDAEATQCAVELKVLIEQMREQIQNIE